jgi:hypothetical protein
MANPWIKKNPFLSMFLSGANSVAAKGRALWMQQARRNQKTAVTQATRAWMSMWTTSSSATKRKRRK